MIKKTSLYFIFLTPVVLWAQANDAINTEIDLSDVVVIEESADSATPTVVEIPEAAVEGASLDLAEPTIPVVAEQMPMGTEVVLEIPGQIGIGATSVMDSAETISVDFPDEDVRTILRNVADLFDLNLVIPDTLQGRISLKLSNITWRQVFEVVLEPLAFTYLEDRNIIRIKSLAELTAEPVDTRVFIANYARAAELKGSVEPLVDVNTGGRIQVDVRSNALVITERPSQMNRIQDIIERLDKPNHQVMIESKFVEVSLGNEFDLGIDWAHVGSNDPNNLVNPGRGAGSGTAFTTTVIEEATGTTPAVLQNVFVDPLGGRGLLAVFSRQEFAATLSALDDQNTSELVSQPTVVVMNNQSAKFQVGVDYPIREVTFNPQTGRTESGEVAKEFIGIDLDVTPSVNASGMISLDIDAELSQLGGAGFANFVESIGGLDPIISKRHAKTMVAIKDGYTIALGGLTAESGRTSDEGIPGLMNLPLIGNLFKTQNDSKSKSNLIIFITAKTLNPDGSDYRDIVDPRVLDEVNHTPAQSPGYDVTAVEAEALADAERIRAEAGTVEFFSDITAE
ncbi:MAG: type II secretion system protein GspD [Lentimonas sp.]